MNKITLSRVYDDQTVIVETTNVEMVAGDLAEMFQDFMLACGYGPSTVKEVFNEEED